MTATPDLRAAREYAIGLVREQLRQAEAEERSADKAEAQYGFTGAIHARQERGRIAAYLAALEGELT